MGGAVSAILNPKNFVDTTLTSLDPGGLVYQSKDKDLQKYQSQVDVGYIGANPKQDAKKLEEKRKLESTRVYETDLQRGASKTYLSGVQI